jgi:hypothetical protein
MNTGWVSGDAFGLQILYTFSFPACSQRAWQVQKQTAEKVKNIRIKNVKFESAKSDYMPKVISGT